MKDIPGDFYNFDRKSNTIIGQNTLAEYSLGDNVKASVLNTNIEKKHIDLKLLDY